VNGWYGNLCQYQVEVPINVNVSTSSPTSVVSVANSTDNSGVLFSISFDFIREIDSSGKTIVSFLLNLQNVTLVVTNNGTNGSPKQYQYQIVLPNQAMATIFLSVYQNGSTIMFANQTVQIPNNGFKYSMQISNWPFANIANRLQISMHTQGSSLGSCDSQSTDANHDGSDNLRSLQIQLNGVSLYGQFVDSAYFDDEIRSVQFSYNATAGDVIIEAPHFWDYVEFDPQFQVLINPDLVNRGCNGTASDSIPTVVIAAVTGSVAGSGIIVAAVAAAVKNKRRKRLSKTLKHLFSNARTSSFTVTPTSNTSIPSSPAL